MAIIRRTAQDGKTRYQVRINVTDPQTGKDDKRTIGTFRTLKAAEKAERDALQDRDAGTLTKPIRITVGELLDQWVKTELPRTVKEENRWVYESVIRNHLKPRFGDVQVKALTVEMVERLYADLLEAGKSTSLIKKCHLRLSAALKMAKRYGYVSSVVTDAAKVPSVKYRQGEVWTPGEVARFLDAAADDAMAPVWRLALETGARTSELLGVRWADFDAGAGTIRFGSQVVRMVKGTPIIRAGGKSDAAERVNRLTPVLVEALKAHRKAQAARRLAAPEWIDNDLIFCTGSGRPYNTRAFRRSFDGIVEDAGIRNIAPHGIRRTAVTLALAGGANVRAVADRVGHRDVSVTLQTYQRITRGMSDDLERIMAGIVSAEPAPGAGEPFPLDAGAG